MTAEYAVSAVERERKVRLHTLVGATVELRTLLPHRLFQLHLELASLSCLLEASAHQSIRPPLSRRPWPMLPLLALSLAENGDGAIDPTANCSGCSAIEQPGLCEPVPRTSRAPWAPGSPLSYFSEREMLATAYRALASRSFNAGSGLGSHLTMSVGPDFSDFLVIRYGVHCVLLPINRTASGPRRSPVPLTADFATASP